MTDKERDALLRETAQHRGFKLVKSRRRNAGGDFGRYGLKAVESGEECLGFGRTGLTATAEEVETFLRSQTASTWKKSLGAVGSRARSSTEKRASVKARKAPERPPPPKGKPAAPQKPAPKRQLRIREADAVDSEALARLVSAFSPTSADEIAERLPLLARAGERPLVARLGDEVVGLITWHVTPVLHRPKPVGRITYLEVDERLRKQGIGRQLVEAVEARLARSGCGAIEVTSNVKRSGAHKFYQALGFERTSYRFGKPIDGAAKR